MSYLLYVVVKFLCYTAWCWLGLWLRHRDGATFLRASGFGLFRLGIGIVAGLSIFFLATVRPEEVLWKYLEIYAPVRLVEWFIIVWVVRWKLNLTIATPGSLLWCIGGILVSFASDLASPEGLEGHFCIGRCLC